LNNDVDSSLSESINLAKSPGFNDNYRPTETLLAISKTSSTVIESRSIRRLTLEKLQSGILHFFATFSSKTVQKRVVAACSDLEQDRVETRSRQGFQRIAFSFQGRKKKVM